MRTWIIPFTLLPLLSMASTHDESSVSKAIDDVTVCELYGSSSPPSGKIRLKATVYKDSRHGARMTSTDCPKGTIVEMSFSEDNPEEPVTKKFHDALWGNVMDISMRAFDFQAEGVFKSEQPARPGGIFYVDHVDWFRKHATEP